MAKTTKESEVNSQETEPVEPAQTLYYEIETAGGDVYINIYGRNKRINIMSGQPSPPITPPKG